MFILLIIAIVSLTACSSKVERRVEAAYSTYDEDNDVYRIDERSFKEAKDLDITQLKKDLPPELYLAYFGFKEVKEYELDFYRPNAEKEMNYIYFEDTEGRKYVILEQNNEIACHEIPKDLNIIQYLDQIIEIDKSNLNQPALRATARNEEETINPEKIIELLSSTQGITVEDKNNLKINKIPGKDEYIVIYSYFDPGMGKGYENKNHIYLYSNDSLKEISFGYEVLPSLLYNVYTGRLELYYPEENKTYSILFPEDVQQEYLRSYSGTPFEDSIYHKSTKIVESNGDCITLEIYPICSIWCNANFATLKHTYQWQDGKWNRIESRLEVGGAIEAYDTIKGVDASMREKWFDKNGAHFKITEENINKIFNITKSEIQDIFGEPNHTEGDGDAYLVYDHFTVLYTGGGLRPWGPTSFILHGNSQEILGAKIGDHFDKIKNVLGTPKHEGFLEEDPDIGILTYYKHGYKFWFEGKNKTAERVIITLDINGEGSY